jgi:hypothetical protein
MGATQAGRTTDWPFAYSVSFFIAICCSNWWAVDIGCRLFSFVFRRLNFSLWLILLSGCVLASATVVRFLNLLLVMLWHSFLPLEIVRQELPQLVFWGHLEQLLVGVMLWMAANYVAYRWAGMPRFGFSSAPPVLAGAPSIDSGVSADDTCVANILRKVRSDRRGGLLAINAQGHYLRVLTDAGEDLILYRFGDAIAQLPADAGVQVHRSWWVSAMAIDQSESISAKKICLDSGIKIPVSRTYQRELEKRISA